MAQKVRISSSSLAERVIATFVASLADPHAPLHCARCIQACIVTLTQNTYGLENLAVLCASHQDVLKTCMNFLTAPRSSEEITRLKSSMSACHCDTSDPCVREMHTADVKSDEPSFATLVNMLIVTVHNAVQPALEAGNVHEVAQNAGIAAQEGRSVPWPATPKDLLPYGPESMIALGAMIDVSPHPIHLGLLGSIMDICLETTIPPFLASPVLSGHVVGIGRIPQIAWIAMTSFPERPSAYTPLDCLADIGRLTLVCQVLLALGNKSQLVQFSNQAEEQNGQGDGVDICSDMLKLLEEVAPAIKPSTPKVRADVARCTAVFANLGARLHLFLAHPFDHKEYHPHILRGSLQRAQQEGNPHAHGL
ncbi:hypothetical protein BOTBODRAFT_37514 [Botryobasidium botryosum FD-172 SS1]|uniref:Uncharacterized protein n=1 Tax=Botryobasidium botryosum (strain FD-172 SS1) TaxID=930990 RepID=A0A067MBL9_BOTB1|nr:hypothetical protein BOTBODRAFT_37514 [Botryobasidium botryosum FD-172 SS1]